MCYCLKKQIYEFVDLLSVISAGKNAGFIGHGARMMTKVRSQTAVQKGREMTLDYLNRTTDGVPSNENGEEPVAVAMSRTTGGINEPGAGVGSNPITLPAVNMKKQASGAPSPSPSKKK